MRRRRRNTGKVKRERLVLSVKQEVDVDVVGWEGGQPRVQL